jgi:hypothetical protein
MWTVQIWVVDLPEPGVLTFESARAAQAVVDLLWEKAADTEPRPAVPQRFKDDFGRTVIIPAADCIGMVEIINQEKHLERHSVEQTQMAYAQIKHQQKMAADPKLKFLQGVGQPQGTPFALAGRS